MGWAASGVLVGGVLLLVCWWEAASGVLVGAASGVLVGASGVLVGGLILPADPRQAGEGESFQGGGGLAARDWFSGFLSDTDSSNYQLFTFPYRVI